MDSAAIGSDGKVYIGSRDNYLYCFNPTNGKTNWKSATGNWFESSPAIDNNGKIYVGSQDDYLYCFNPANGKTNWKSATGGLINSSPGIGSDGKIYVGGDDNYFYCFNPTNGKTNWKSATGASIDMSSSAIGSDGKIYVGSEDNYLYCFNANGTTNWKALTGGQIYSSPAIGSDGKIYIGCYNDGNLYCFSVVSNYHGPYYVATNGNDNNIGAKAAPFKTIQHAANLMMPGPPNCTSATTYVYPGTYTNQITINSNKNSGYMAFTEETNIKPVIRNLIYPVPAIQIINAPNVMIKNFSINEFNGLGIIWAQGTHNLVIQSNFISRNINNNGIYLNGGNNNIIANNRITSNRNGIEFWNQTNLEIINNMVASNSQSGLNLQGQNYQAVISNNTIFHSSFLNNGGGGNDGIDISSGSSYIYIKKNTIYSNVYFNTPNTNYQSGISFGSGTVSSIFIISNDIYGVGNGIQNQGSSGIYIKNNTLSNCKFGCININSNMSGGPSVYANSNTIVSNYLNGNNISINAGKNHSIIGNIIKNIPWIPMHSQMLLM